MIDTATGATLSHRLEVGDRIETAHEEREGRIVRIVGNRYRVKLRDCGEIREFEKCGIVYNPPPEVIKHRAAAVQAQWTGRERRRRIPGFEKVEAMVWRDFCPEASHFTF